jgi:hypothetical protein
MLCQHESGRCSIQIIDDDGDLFGVVNVVDALVVLLVLAVVAARVALVNPFTPSEEATRYATVDLGEQRPYVEELVSEGDILSQENSESNVTVRDVHVTPTASSKCVHVSGLETDAKDRVCGSIGDEQTPVVRLVHLLPRTELSGCCSQSRLIRLTWTQKLPILANSSDSRTRKTVPSTALTSV